MQTRRAPITFDEWADAVSLRVLAVVPGVRVKRQADELYRWTLAGKECQVHALYETRAAFVALSARQGNFPVCGVYDHVPIEMSSHDEVAARIVNWLVT